METISLSPLINIYKTQLDINNIALIPELELNVNVNEITSNKQDKIPGTQSVIIIDGPNIKKLRQACILELQKALQLSTEEPYLLETWVYISTNDNNETLYHRHVRNRLFRVVGDSTNDFTFTYYVQMPNNLQGNEGRLFFTTNDYKYETSILPKVGELYIFPADLLHRPELNPNSTVDRIVVGGSYKKLELGRNQRKIESTLF